MKYKVILVTMLAVMALAALSAAIVNEPNNNSKDDENTNKTAIDREGMSMLTGLAAYTEKVCSDKGDVVFCYDKTFVECNGKRFEMPEKINYLMQEKVYLQKECPPENIILKEMCGGEKNSPSDWIKEEKIHMYPDRIVVGMSHPTFRRIYNTNSMDPLFDETTTTIEIPLSSEDELNIGDIAAYTTEKYDYAVLHRIINISSDEKGKYFILKGDNNKEEDKEKVRFSQIEGVVVGILY